jgi:hypothetical protein
MYERAYSLTEASSSDLKSVFPGFSCSTNISSQHEKVRSDSDIESI